MYKITYANRYSLIILISIILASFSATAQTVSEITGEASVVVVDQVDGTSELQYYVIDKINQRETRVFFRGQADPKFKTGKQLKVRGKSRADRKGFDAESVLLLDESSSSGDASVAAPVAAAETRNVLTILVNFNDATVTGGSHGVSLQDVKNRMFNDTKNVADFFDNASLTTLTIPADPDDDGVQDVFGPYLIDDSYIGGDSSQCTASTWVSKASAAWQTANPDKDINLYRHRLLIVPNYWDYGNRHCGWGGVAQLNCGSWCWAIAADPKSVLHGVIIHELGHNFGLHHASTDPDNNGSLDSEYGDSSDMMGGSRNWMKFNPPHFEDKGWMDNLEYEIRTVTATSNSQSFDLIPVDEEAWTWPGLRALKVERSTNSDYYISFRQQTGDYNNVSSGYTNGLSLHYGTDGSTRSVFVRMIAPGETFVDSAAGVSITATSQTTVFNNDNTDSVQVMGVEICDSVCSVVPAPTNLVATAVAKDMIDVVWNDNHNAEDGYRIEHSDNGSTWSHLITLGANAALYTHTGLATASTHYYRVQTLEGGEASSFSNVANATTLAVPPTANFTYNASYTEASFVDASSDSDGSVISWSWNFGDGNGSNSQSPTHTYASGNTYPVTLTVTDNHGATAEVTKNVTVENPPFANFYASAESTSGGTLNGNLNATKANDGAVEAIEERDSGGKPSNRHSWLEHQWTINVGAAGAASLVVNAWQSESSDDDTFDFQWSTNGTSWSPALNVAATNNQLTPMSFALPPGTTGTVYIRVIDTDRTSGNRSKDIINVDLLMVQVANASGEPPGGDPANLSATALSYESISLEWADNSDNETGFSIERRIFNSGNSFEQVGVTGANSGTTAVFTDNGLQGSTTYEYRVIGFNGLGDSEYSNIASATTDVAPDIELVASGGKVKGTHVIDLSWSVSSASAMDILEDGSIIGSVASGTTTYTHNTGNKGGATYVYKVCQSGTNTCSNSVTVPY